MTDDEEFRFGLEREELRLPISSAISVGSTPNGALQREPLGIAIRQLASDCDRVSGEAFELALLWAGLCSGAQRIVLTFGNEERCYVVVERNIAASNVRRISPTRLDVLERVLLGQSPKAVALDRQVSISTVAGAMKSCLSKMGLDCRASSRPALLVMAATAARHPERDVLKGRISRFEYQGRKLWVVSAQRPDFELSQTLSRAELRVVRHLVDGLTYTQISRLRGTSSRTIANQLGAAFRKLGVSGRQQLLDRLIYRPGAASPRELS
jgi:DNA-binding NarL/FixJ family response regulator